MSNNQIVYLRVDELDEKPRLFRRLSDPIPRQFIPVPNFPIETSSSFMKIKSSFQM